MRSALRTTIAAATCAATSAFASLSSVRVSRFGTAMKARVTADQVLAQPKWPEAWPYKEADFQKSDMSNDGNFYAAPRLVYHIDDGAVRAVTQYYSEVFGLYEKPDVLDMCSSWVSHFPTEGIAYGRRSVSE